MPKVKKSKSKDEPKVTVDEQVHEGNGDVVAVEAPPVEPVREEEPKATQEAPEPKKGRGRPKKGKTEEGEASTERPVLYPDHVAAFYCQGYFEPDTIGAHEGPMTAARMKELLGWTEVMKGETDYDLRDAFGTKVRLVNNYGNRPLSKMLYDNWKLEILKKHWRFNGESIIIGRHGMVISGQHRGVALILAVQEWSKPSARGKPNPWHDYWGKPDKGGTEPFIEQLVVYGVAEDDATVNTVDTGRPRTSADAVFRSSFFQGYLFGERRALARSLEFAVRTVWDRTGQTDSGFTPRRMHADTFDFIESHKKLIDAVEFVFKLDCGREHGNKGAKPWNLISRHVGPGVASGLLYLFAACKSDFDKYHTRRRAGEASQRQLDMSMWDTAKQFWAEFAAASQQYRGDATRVSPLLPLMHALEAARIDGRNADLDVRLALIVKAWKSYVANEGEVVKDDLRMNRKTHPVTGVDYFDDYPEIGGIDIPNTDRRDSLVERMNKLGNVGAGEGDEDGGDIDGAEGFSPDDGDNGGDTREDDSEDSEGDD